MWPLPPDSPTARGSLKLCDILRSESCDPFGSDTHARELKVAQLSRHKSYAYGWARSGSDPDSSLSLGSSFGFPCMNSMQERLGVRFIESATGLSISSASRDRQDPNAKTNVTINVAIIGDDHLHALENASVEQQQALLPYIEGRRPVRELGGDDAEALLPELRAVTLQQYVDTMCAHSEVLQLQGKVDAGLRCLQSSARAVDAFISSQILVAGHSSHAAESQVFQQADAAMFASSVSSSFCSGDELRCAGLGRWYQIACVEQLLTMSLAAFVKRTGAMLKLLGRLPEARVVTLAAIEFCKVSRSWQGEHCHSLPAAYALLTNICMEMGQNEEALKAELFALELVVATNSFRAEAALLDEN